ncbi:MAG TPA: hypothetical protein ENI87_11205, partial [bacterium]|nr:hypothetical protein [bacterium]
MALPLSFLAGLLVVAAHRELGMSLPGEATGESVALGFALLLVPLLLALVARQQAAFAMTSARRPLVPPRALLRLSALGTPLALHALFAIGHYGDCIDRLAPVHPAMRIALSLLPLYLLELPRLMVTSLAEVLVEVSGDERARRPLAPHLLPSARDVWPTVRLRFGWPILVLMPAAMLGLLLELLVLDRAAYVHVFATSFGLSLAAIAFLLLAAMVLPFWFRVAFGVERTLPEPAGSVLRSAASALGFSPRRLFVVRTGMRAMNAMMVGPLPIGRMLGLTDGLLVALDPRALTGVLAHEIGHARMGHPGMLMSAAVLVPMAMMAPLQLLDLDEADVTL